MKRTAGKWNVGFSDGSGSGKHHHNGAYITVHKEGNATVVIRGGTGDWGLEVGVVGATQEEKIANAIFVAVAGTSANQIEGYGYDGQKAIENLTEIVNLLEAANDLYETERWKDCVRTMLDKLKLKNL